MECTKKLENEKDKESGSETKTKEKGKGISGKEATMIMSFTQVLL